jgi:subtilisin-like proprotein convertase family protein
LAFFDLFDGEVLQANWAGEGGLMIVNQEEGRAIQANNAQLKLMGESLGELAVQASFQIAAGSSDLGFVFIRQTGERAYSASLDAEGIAVLYRNGVVIAEQKASVLAQGDWHILRLSAFADVVRVDVDGVNIITWRDTEALPAGGLSLAVRTSPETQILVDNFALWRPASELVTTPTLEATPEPKPSALPEATESAAEGKPSPQGLENNPRPILTDEWAVILQAGADPLAVAASLGMEYIGPVGELPNTYLLRAAGSESQGERSNQLRSGLSQLRDVVWFEQQVATQYSSRQTTDPTPNTPNGAITLEGQSSGGSGQAARNGSGSLGQSYAYTLNGGVVTASRGLRGTGEGTMVLSGIPSGSSVFKAFLYYTTIGTNGPTSGVYFNGNYISNPTPIGTGDSTCWTSYFEEFNYVHRTDVTHLVTGNGSYSISGLPRFGGDYNDSQGATLVVIYQRDADPRRTIVINDGAITLNSYGQSATNTLNSFAASLPSVDSKLILIVGDGQTAPDGNLFFNGVSLGSNQFSGSSGNFWDTKVYNLTTFRNIAAPASVRMQLPTGSYDCLVWAASILSISTNPRFSDPMLPNQWHLQNMGQWNGVAGQDLNVVPAWNRGYSGAGVTIAIVDDGLQYTHPDIAPNYVPSGSYDYNGNDADPMPASYNGHGTSAGGVAAAADETTCGVGVAYNAGLSGIRLIASPSTDAQVASALNYQMQINQIYSNSWGPGDSGSSLDGAGPLARNALANGVTNGRGGRGSIYVWAAGNGLQTLDNVNADSYANSPYTIAVGAADNRGIQSSYSEPGSAIFVTAPSSGNNVGIYTTDLLGYGGYSNGDCTDSFGGTSSATPAVSGVIALMLQANPNLGWRDVQHILALTAFKNDPRDPGWRVNRDGFNVNHKYGFGRVNADAAVRLAMDWFNVGPRSTHSSITYPYVTIPDNNSTGISSSIVMNVSDPSFVLEHVEVVVDIGHTYRGDLEIFLTSPSGMVSQLMTLRPRDSGDHFSFWRMMTVHNWGEKPNGVWTLRVADRDAGVTGVFYSWQIILHGYSRPTAPTTAPIQATPGSALLTNNNMPSFIWNPVLNATAYQIEIDNNSNFSSPEVVRSVGSTSIDLASLGISLGDGLYHWRVRARNGNRFGPFSSVRTLTIDVTSPEAPALNTPLNNALLSVPRPSLSWRPSVGATRYHLQVDNNSDFSSPEISQHPITSTSFTPAFPLMQGVYYWRVRAYDAAGNVGPYSLARTVNLSLQTSPTVNQFFTTRAPATTHSPSFRWTAYGVAGTFYRLQISSTSNFSSVIFNHDTTLLSYTLAAYEALGYGTYWWRVLVNGVTPPDAVTRSFTISPAAPPVTQSLSPVSGFKTNISMVSLQWLFWTPTNTYPLPVTYEIQADNNSNFSSPEYWNAGLNGTSLSVNLGDGTYFWRVRAVNGYGLGGPWSALRSFVIDTTPPPAPTLLAPLSGTATRTLRPAFTWNKAATAVRYELVISTDSNFSSSTTISTTGTSYTPPVPLEFYMIYWWRVRAIDSMGNISPWSQTWVFRAYNS